MMEGFSFTTPGLAGFERKLLDMGTVVARKIGRSALRQASNVVLEEVRLLALPHRKTGILQKAITVQDHGTRGDTIYFSVTVRSKAFYAKFVEFGTLHAPPYPFMRPAAEQAAIPAIEALAVQLGVGLEIEWSKAA